MSELSERLRQAAGWVGHEDMPAPDWDGLLEEAADRIEALEARMAKALARLDDIDGYSPNQDGPILDELAEMLKIGNVVADHWVNGALCACQNASHAQQANVTTQRPR